MNEMVKYHNDLNTAVMSRWSSAELNLFFTVVAKSRDKGSRMIKLDAAEIKELIGFTPTSKKRWDNVIRNAVLKLSKIQYYEEDESKLEVMQLFSRFIYNKKANTLEVILGEDYNYILNSITSNFTIFELKEFVELKSTYSKTMYRLLKQWRTVGKKRFKKEEIFLLLSVPLSTQDSTNFKKRVLTPVTEELSPIFKGFKVELIRSKRQGRPITHYEFTWQAETAGTWIEGKYDKPKYTPKTKQKIIKEIPDWLDNTSTLQQPADPEKTKQIQEKLTLLFGESD